MKLVVMKNDAFTSHHGFAVGSTIVSIVNCAAAVGPPIGEAVEQDLERHAGDRPRSRRSLASSR
jgi:hypothetical protein